MTAPIWERPYADRKAVQCLQNGTNTAKSQRIRITRLNMDELYKPGTGGGGMEEEDRF